MNGHTVISLCFALLLVSASGLVQAHGTEKHDEPEPTNVETPAPGNEDISEAPENTESETSAHIEMQGLDTDHDKEAESNSVNVSSSSPARPEQRHPLDPAGLIQDMGYAGFPTLHPLAVHVPVILIPLAALFILIHPISPNVTYYRLSVVFLAAGVAGGFIAAFPLHPHTSGLSYEALDTLRKHDYFAYSTLIKGSLALLFALLYVVIRKRFIKIVFGSLVVLSALAVVITGHYGGKLAYVHGIGVQGNFLDNSH